MMLKLFQEVHYQNLEEPPLEVPKVGGHELFNACRWGSLPKGNAQGLGKMPPDACSFPKAWQVW